MGLSLHQFWDIFHQEHSLIHYNQLRSHRDEETVRLRIHIANFYKIEASHPQYLHHSSKHS